MARKQHGDDFHFEGFESPNTTPVPDVVFDRLLAQLGEAELKALLYIIRRTFGFKRDRDPISFNQFLRGITTRDGRVLDEGCGVRNRTTLSNALKSLEEKGIIRSEKGEDERGENITTVYMLRFKNDDERGVVRNPYHRSTEFAPPVVRHAYPQETVEQQTVKQETDHSNIRKAPISKIRRGTMTEPPEAPAPARYPPSDFQAQGAALQPRRGRPTAAEAEARRVILAYIGDYARELNDQAKLKASTTRAFNLYRQAGVALDVFSARLSEARAITQEQTAAIRTRVDDGTTAFPRKNKMAYFFAVLEDLLGVREGRADIQEEARDAADERSPVRFGQLPRRQ